MIPRKKLILDEKSIRVFVQYGRAQWVVTLLLPDLRLQSVLTDRNSSRLYGEARATCARKHDIGTTTLSCFHMLIDFILEFSSTNWSFRKKSIICNFQFSNTVVAQTTHYVWILNKLLDVPPSVRLKARALVALKLQWFWKFPTSYFDHSSQLLFS